MVTTRITGEFSDLQRSVFPKILEKIGQNNITLTHYSETLDSNQQVTSVTSTTSTVTGDLQFVTFEDKQLLDTGIVTIGDGIFYCIYSTSLNRGDRITVNGVDWELTRQVEAETIDGNRIYQGWVAVRRM